MQKTDYEYEKFYIFVDGVRIPLAFMDCANVELKKIEKKKKSGNDVTQMMDNVKEIDNTEMIRNEEKNE